MIWLLLPLYHIVYTDSHIALPSPHRPLIVLTVSHIIPTLFHIVPTLSHIVLSVSHIVPTLFPIVPTFSHILSLHSLM